MRKIDTICLIPNCGKPHHSKGFCRSHYRKILGENKQRWQKVKNDPTLLKKTKEAIKKYRQSDHYKEIRKLHDKKYYIENKKELLDYRKTWRDLKRFGTDRENILYRDGYTCVLCGSNKNLVVHHRNGRGRCTDNPDNEPKNLTTLCRSCHMKIHKQNE